MIFGNILLNSASIHHQYLEKQAEEKIIPSDGYNRTDIGALQYTARPPKRLKIQVFQLTYRKRITVGVMRTVPPQGPSPLFFS